MTVYEILNKIQVGLKAPKNQTNAFGKYKYRSCEDILEAVKPWLNGSIVTIDDEVLLIGARYYIKATISITFDGISISKSAYARESEAQKGMSESQLTGSASSYARKYSANGLFCIDDTKDADTMDNTSQKPEKAKSQPFNEYSKQMTGKQKGTLKDQIVELDKIGSDSTIKAGTAINTFLGSQNPGFDDAAHLINKVKLTLEKE